MGLLELRVVPGPPEVVLPAFLDSTFSAVVSEHPTDDPQTWAVIYRSVVPGGCAVVHGSLAVVEAMEDAGFVVADKAPTPTPGLLGILGYRPPAPPLVGWTFPDTGNLWVAVGRELVSGPGLVVDPWATGSTAPVAHGGSEWVGITPPGGSRIVIDEARRYYLAA